MKRERGKGRKKKKKKEGETAGSSRGFGVTGDLYLVQPLLSRLLLPYLLFFFFLPIAEKKTVRTGMRFLRLKEPE